MIGEMQIVPSWLADAKALPGAQATKPADPAAAQAAKDLHKIASDFETVFSKMLLTSMRKTVDKSPLFHAGRGEEIFSDLLDNHYSEALSKKGKGLGIADMIVKKYAAHVKAQEDQKGRSLDTGKGRSVAPAGSVEKHD